MTVRAGGRVGGLAHRATLFEHFVAGSAAELVQRHVTDVSAARRERSCRLCLTVPVTKLAPMTVEVIPETEHVPQTGEPASAHIVKTEPGESAAAKVLEARRQDASAE